MLKLLLVVLWKSWESMNHSVLTEENEGPSRVRSYVVTNKIRSQPKNVFKVTSKSSFFFFDFYLLRFSSLE